MSLFPLYDEVVSAMDGKETVLNQSQCSTIARLGQENLDIIYLLILHHYSLGDKTTNPESSDQIPYGGRTISNGKGILYRKLNQIPSDLQKIIFRYLEMISN